MVPAPPQKGGEFRNRLSLQGRALPFQADQLQVHFFVHASERFRFMEHFPAAEQQKKRVGEEGNDAGVGHHTPLEYVACAYTAAQQARNITHHKIILKE